MTIFLKCRRECFIGLHQGHSGVPSTYNHSDFFLINVKFYFQILICNYVGFSGVYLCNRQYDLVQLEVGLSIK